MERISNSFFSPSGSRKQNLQSVSVSGSYMVAVLALILLTFAIAAGFFWYLSYGFENTPPKTVAIQHISEPANIAWYPNGLSTIRSNDLNASLAALGYAHAVKNPWQMMLWRQTALGSLSSWFGPNLLRLDRFTKQLRLANTSQTTYEDLSKNDQDRLIAYTAGINQAITEQHLLAHNDFAFLGSDIAPWEPWHTLALERLFAWLATNFSDINELPEVERENILREVIEPDEFLHKFLQVYDFQFSFTGAWHSTDAQEADFFFQRFVYGASAHTIVQEVNFQLQSQQEVLVSTIPGTLIFLSGHSTDKNWAILPTSTLSLGRHHITHIPEITHERITNRDGTEILVTVNHFPGLLNLESTLDTETDSSFALYWNGFTKGTDAFSFLAMLAGTKPTLNLLEGDGLWQQDQQFDVIGEPAYRYNLSGGILVSSDQRAFYIASHLDSLCGTTPALLNPKLWPGECYNPWAAQYGPALIRGIANAPSLQSAPYDDAITYLRNWDFSYTSSSIGAAIFERWLANLKLSSTSNQLPFSTSTDSTVRVEPTIESARLINEFKRTIDSLNTTLGADLSQWRLEQTQPVVRYFPAWSADSLFSADDSPLSETNYAPLVFPGKGDVATLCNGSFDSPRYGTVSAQWEAWSTSRDDKHAIYWRKQIAPESFLERYLISNRPNVEFRFLPEDDQVIYTRITPAS